MRSDQPIIENAPGLTWRKKRDNWIATWRPQSRWVKQGYPPAGVLLWRGVEVDEISKVYLQEQCQRLHGEMILWSKGIFETGVYDGTLRSLIGCYQTDPDSKYHTLRPMTRHNYDALLLRIAKERGAARLAEVDARTVLAWYRGWSGNGTKIPQGHSMVTMLRTVLTFGTTFLTKNDPEGGIAKLRALLADMTFAVGKPRKEILTREQVIAVRRAAHAAGRPSIALAQAIQFEATLRQKDVIGEWVPITEPDLSTVLHHRSGRKWVRGLRWEEIDQNLILRHRTSKRDKDIEVDLRLAPMVLEELGDRRGTGPLIIDEKTGYPYDAAEFRRRWREIARAAGVPDHVLNMDTRAGAITEALEAGARLQDVRKAATHSNESMTQRYSRGDAKAVAEVMRLRQKNDK